MGTGALGPQAHGDPFESGDLVLLHSPAVARGQCRKLHRPWTGPFRIVRRLSDAVYRVRNTQARCQCLVVHFDRLKPCPPSTRIPEVSPRVRSQAATPPPAPPLGSSLELLDSPDSPCPTHSSLPPLRSFCTGSSASRRRSLNSGRIHLGGELCNSNNNV